MKKNLLTFFFALIICLIILEIFLRVFDPFHARLQGDEILLPANKKYVIKNNRIPGTPADLVHNKNSLGFRGPNVPQNFQDYLSIVVIGGSTTECFYLADQETWPAFLGQKLAQRFHPLWLNNAGMDGHSTFGHTILFRDFLAKMKPKICLFLVGLNDMGRDDLNYYENATLKNRRLSKAKQVLYKSSIIYTIQNLKRMMAAKHMDVMHKSMNLAQKDTLTLDLEIIWQEIQGHNQKGHISGYRSRLHKLILEIKQNNMEPILMTQPVLWGSGIDPVTGVNLETVKLGDHRNGKLFWQVLESYNDVTRKIALFQNVFLIDLAEHMPKDSRFYYDGIHFTTEGARQVAQIIDSELAEHLAKKYPSYLKASNN